MATPAYCKYVGLEPKYNLNIKCHWQWDQLAALKGVLNSMSVHTAAIITKKGPKKEEKCSLNMTYIQLQLLGKKSLHHKASAHSKLAC